MTEFLPGDIRLEPISELGNDWKWWNRIYGHIGEACEIVPHYKKQLASFAGEVGQYTGFQWVYA